MTIETATHGSEFLAWLWWLSEESFGRVIAGDVYRDMWAGDRVLVSTDGSVDVRGGTASGSDAARLALAHGGRLAAIRFGMRDGPLDYTFELLPDLHVRGLRLPDVQDEDERIRERLQGAAIVNEWIDLLWARFAEERRSPAWAETHERMQIWLADNLGIEDVRQVRIPGIETREVPA